MHESRDAITQLGGHSDAWKGGKLLREKKVASLHEDVRVFHCLLSNQGLGNQVL